MKSEVKSYFFVCIHFSIGTSAVKSVGTYTIIETCLLVEQGLLCVTILTGRERREMDNPKSS